MNLKSIRFSVYLTRVLGSEDIRQQYRRSNIGTFWLTIGMAVQVATMAIVFSLIFKTELSEYLPFLATSLVLWGTISSSLNDGCQGFIAGEAIIKQLEVPPLTHVFRVIWKNCLVLLHNLIILPLTFLAVGHGIQWQLLLALPGLLLLFANLAWIAIVLGVVSARFRDLPQIVNSLVTIFFYITPVMWFPSLIGNNTLAHLLLGLNPLYHILQVVRVPILNGLPTQENWLISFGFAAIGWLFALILFRKVRNQIPFWV